DEPARQGFAVVMIDYAGQRTHFSRYDYPVPMTFVRIARVFDTIKNDSRRIKRSSQGPAMNAVDKGSAIAGHFVRPAQVRQLLDEAITYFVIGIQRQSPFGFNLGKTEVALIGETVERPLEQRNLTIAREDIERPIRAATVHNDNAPCPG